MDNAGKAKIIKEKNSLNYVKNPLKISVLEHTRFATVSKSCCNRGKSVIIENSDNYYKNSHNSLMDNSEKPILINRIIHNVKNSVVLHDIKLIMMSNTPGSSITYGFSKNNTGYLGGLQ